MSDQEKLLKNIDNTLSNIFWILFIIMVSQMSSCSDSRVNRDVLKELKEIHLKMEENKQ